MTNKYLVTGSEVIWQGEFKRIDGGVEAIRVIGCPFPMGFDDPDVRMEIAIAKNVSGDWVWGERVDTETTARLMLSIVLSSLMQECGLDPMPITHISTENGFFCCPMRLLPLIKKHSPHRRLADAP